LKPWDIYSYQPPKWNAAHPCVIVSHAERVATKTEVNVLMCSSQPARRPPDENEVILDQADGLNWPTLCKCDLLYAVEKSNISNHRGHVTEERRRQIIVAINRSNGWV
jgi:hypothetical protein